jgi:pimeloyl-ACP methyl ester carboxylesterase
MESLLLLPGLLCDAWVWQAQVEGLRDVCEMRPWPNFYGYNSLEGMARAVLAAAPERIHVCGHSMGGRVAFEMVRAAPERILSLVLLDTSTGPAAPEETEARGELVALARREGMAAMAAEWLPPMVHPKRLSDRPFMDALTQMVCRATPEIFAKQQHALLMRSDAHPLLPKIACPTLVGCGADDAWSPLAQHEEIAAAIPGAQLVSIPDSGHMVSVEAPDALTACLRDWMHEHGARR